MLIYREHLCGYDLNFTYPQEGGHFPTLIDPFKTTGAAGLAKKKPGAHRRRSGHSTSKGDMVSRTLPVEDQIQQWKRDLTSRPSNGTLDPHYGCFLYMELLDYASNFSFPWSKFTMSRAFFVAECRYILSIDEGGFDVSLLLLALTSLNIPLHARYDTHTSTKI